MFLGLALWEFMLVIILSHFITTKGLKNQKRLSKTHGKLEWFCQLWGCVL